MMTIDMTAELAPLLWGMIGLLAVSVAGLLGSYLAQRRGRGQWARVTARRHRTRPRVVQASA